MRDDEFDRLLGSALRAEAAPLGLRERLLTAIPGRRAESWLALMLSPVRVAAGAGVLSLMLGFALGAGNAAIAEEPDVAVVTALYAGGDIGDL